MTESISPARGKQLLNSLLTTAGLVAVVVAGVTLHANLKGFREPDISSYAAQGLNPQTTTPDSGSPAAIPQVTSALSSNGSSPMEEISGIRHAGHQWQASYRMERISADCNGSPVGGANFRQYPTMDDRVILGGVDAGQTVWVTGRSITSDGVVWYEVMNPMPLFPVNDSMSQNRLDAYQFGWIAACFLD